MPSLIVIIPARIILCLQSGESLASIPLFLTTIPFWTKHNGDWFLDFILVAYLIAPLLRWLYDRIGHELILTMILVAVFVLIGNSFFGLIRTDNQVWFNVSYITQRFPGFFIGYYIAHLMKEKEKIPYWTTAIGPIVCAALLVLKIDVHFGWILAISAVIWLCVIFDGIKVRWVHNVLSWLGAISLESYLTNVYVANFLSYTGIQKFFNGYPYYGIVIVVGLILATIVHKAAQPVLIKLDKPATT